MIDAQTTMKNQSFHIDQFYKEEVVIEEHQFDNQETVRKAIKKYQNKITDMLKIMTKQKKQNDALKTQLKTLNESLNNVIGKLNAKNIKTNQSEQVKDEAIKKELDNQIKRNVHLQKQLQQLRVKVKGLNAQQMSELKNQLAEKDRQIEQLTLKLKTYEKFEKQTKNMDIYKKEQELNSKVVSLNEQIQFLKGKVAQQKKQQELQQKQLKRQHQQLLAVEPSKSKPKDNKSTTHQLMKSSPVTKRSVDKIAYLKQKYQSVEGQKKMNEKSYVQKIHQLQNKCQNLETSKKTLQKHSKFETEALKNKIKSLEFQIEENKTILKRKEQEAHILVSRMKETQRKNYHALEPVQKIKNVEELSTTNGIFDQRKQFRGLVHVQGNVRKFDDTENLPFEKNYRIKSFTFTWHDEYILSLSTIYQLKDGSTKQVISFNIEHEFANVKHNGLELSEFQYINEIQIFCGKAIEYLKIKTSRDRVLEIGNQRNRTKCRQFNFDIRNNEKPIAFLGTLDTKKVVGVEGQKQVLISFGLEIKKKEVMGKSRIPKTKSLAKYPSKSVLQKYNVQYNDKNIEDETK